MKNIFSPFFIVFYLIIFAGLENRVSAQMDPDIKYNLTWENDDEDTIIDPEFPSGMDAFYRYLSENIKYPPEAKNKWNPGRKNGQPVRIQQTLPVNFYFSDDKDSQMAKSEINPLGKKDLNNNSDISDCDFTEFTFDKIKLCFHILSKKDRTCAVSSKQDEINGGLTIPRSVTHEGISFTVVEIGEKAFYGMSGINAVYIPASIRKIGHRAFWGCYNIDVLNIPNSVDSIGANAFLGVEKIRYNGNAIGSPWGANEVLSGNTSVASGKNAKEEREKDSSKKTQKKDSPCPSHTKVETTEAKIRVDIDKSNDGITGIYEGVANNNFRLAVLGDGSSYYIYYIAGANNKCWEVGHIKAKLRPTATTGLFKGAWYMADFSENNNCVILFDGIKMDVVIDNERLLFLKMYPSQESSPEIANTPEEVWSGTGWALGNGYLVTNNHVIEEAHSIIVKGVGGNLSRGFSAKVVAKDRINDIAIIKINDSKFKGYGALPYAVSPRIVDVGEDIFVLGYPLGDALGEEIKLTTGVINSRSGFGDFQNCYQIQAPITYGNSGGPVFDSKGNVIGIVIGGLNKKLNLAENVGYAVKTSYLKILIENAGLNISFPSKNTISSLSRPEKVKRVKKFVYYIECSK